VSRDNSVVHRAAVNIENAQPGGEMAASYGFTKRQKERQRQEKQREKQLKRKQRREQRAANKAAGMTGYPEGDEGLYDARPPFENESSEAGHAEETTENQNEGSDAQVTKE
jgi:hypothetical protein